MKTNNVSNTEFNYVLPAQVREFITSQFSNAQIKRSINQPGSILNSIVNKLETKPLFYYNGNKESRFVFSSWYGLLDIRHNTYTNPLLRDLYLLHELNHQTSIKYATMNTMQWIVAHIRNEKATSFWSEALVYFEYPSIFEQTSKTFDLWVTPYFKDEMLLIPGISNQVLYAQSREFCSALLFQEFVKISIKDYASLSAAELRTRNYDFATETWCEINSVLQVEVNRHILDYHRLLEIGRETEAIALHHNWLTSNFSDRGVLFDKSHPLFTGIDSKTMFRASKNTERAKTLTTKYNVPYNLSLQAYLDKVVSVMQEEENAGNIMQTPLVSPTKTLISQAGVTNTIYSLFTLPSREIVDALKTNNELQDQLYGMGESRKQDGINKLFIEQYKAWTNGVVEGLESFAHTYPTAGSSEALRESIIELTATARSKGRDIKVHLFQAEYEGTKSYCVAASIPTIEHANRKLDNLISSTELRAGDLFYISYPSSIDGNAWPDLNRFLDLMQSKGVRVLLDLTYFGSYIPVQKIPANHPAVECVYFSLSKSFGVYYHRVGGMFSRNPINLLVGNKWFKNTFSMHLGINLMQKYAYHAIPKFYQGMQQAATWYVNAKLNTNLMASNVFLIAQQEINRAEYNNLPHHLKILCRSFNDGENYVLRVCLQPIFDYLTNEFHKSFPVFNFAISNRSSQKNSVTAKSCSHDSAKICNANIEALQLQNWHFGSTLKKAFNVPTAKVRDFAEDIRDIATKLNHHPSLLIRDNLCSIELITHANNAITEVDAKTAKEIDKLAQAYSNDNCKALTFSAKDMQGSIAETFTFKNFDQAFDFAFKAYALIATPDRARSNIQIGWGECKIEAPARYIATFKAMYSAEHQATATIKYRAKL